jgi:hypothetical protein
MRGRGLGVDQHRLVKSGIADQSEQRPSARGAVDLVDQVTERPAEIHAGVGIVDAEIGEVRVDLVDVELDQLEPCRVDLIAEDAGELGGPFGVVGVILVPRSDDQFVRVRAAAVLGRAGSTPRGADCPYGRLNPWQDRLQLDRVLPVVAEVVVVEQPVARLDEHFVQADVILGNARLPFVNVEGTQVVLGVPAPEVGPGAEPVQVTVGPTEGRLDDVVKVVEEQVGRKLQTAPDGRRGPLQVDANLISHDVVTA